MTEDHKLAKVDILIQQNKFDEAERLLSDLLAQDSNNVYMLSLLAEIKLQQDNYPQANRIINNAIGLSPDTAYLFFIKSRIDLQQENLKNAEKYINEAIRLDPYEADYFALLANIHIIRKQFKEGLETANRALEIDAQNILAINMRSTALNKLNRSEEAFATIEGALREDPNNPYTHSNYGWGLLEKGDHKKALEHFKEALSQDPNYTYAQSGMQEALKASNPVYRMFLKYAFFMSNITGKYQWGVIIGFYLGFRFLGRLARNNEGLQPFLYPVLIVLALIAFSTWVITPISNLFLRFNKYGNYLLDKNEKRSSNLVAISFMVFIVGLLLFIILKDVGMLAIAIYGFAMMIPFGSMFSPAKNNTLQIYTIALGLIGLISIGITLTSGEFWNVLTPLFVLGFVGFQWIANFILIGEDNY